MVNSKRYFNQKFIALIFIIFGSTILTHQTVISGYVYATTVLVAYAVFAGLEAFTVTKEGITMNKDNKED